MWRPENWYNRYADSEVKQYDETTDAVELKDGFCIYESSRRGYRDIFEAGADAILKALGDTQSLPEVKAILWGNKPIIKIALLTEV